VKGLAEAITEKWPVVGQSELDPEFHKVFLGLPGGEQLRSCIQCGTCSGSCPSALEMDHSPRKLMAMIRAGMKDEVLRSNTPWYCSSCYSCSVRCPRGISITDVMYLVKTMSLLEGQKVFTKTFTRLVLKYGRMHESGLMVRLNLRSPLKLVGYSPLGMKMFLKGKIRVFPKKAAAKDMQKLYAYAQRVSP